MSDHRAQGRPCRGVSEVGREKILAAVRDLLRSNRCNDLSRKAVAAFAGVTPALISYYFPKKQQLLEEAVTPIVTAYADEICRVSESTAAADTKTQEIISILMRLYKRDGKILDVYRDSIEKPAGVPDQIAKMTSALTQLFPVAGSEHPTSQLDAAIFQGAMWGMCRFAAQAEQSMLLEVEGSSRLDGLRKRVAETLLNIVNHTPMMSASASPSFLSPGR